MHRPLRRGGGLLRVGAHTPPWPSGWLRRRGAAVPSAGRVWTRHPTCTWKAEMGGVRTPLKQRGAVVGMTENTMNTLPPPSPAHSHSYLRTRNKTAVCLKCFVAKFPTFDLSRLSGEDSLSTADRESIAGEMQRVKIARAAEHVSALAGENCVCGGGGGGCSSKRARCGRLVRWCSARLRGTAGSQRRGAVGQRRRGARCDMARRDSGLPPQLRSHAGALWP